MEYFDGIGIQINITDDWPADIEARKKLRQCSDYIEIVNDLNDCIRLMDVLEKLSADPKHEFNFMNEVKLPPIPLGTVARSVDSAFYSRYGRCFNSSKGRISIEDAVCQKNLGGDLYRFHEELLGRRNESIAHAHSVEGRQPIRVLNWQEDKPQWNVDTSTTIDPIPRWDTKRSELARNCCTRLIDHCLTEKNKAWKTFKRKLTEDEAEQLRAQHYTQDQSGSGYPVETPASTRN